MKENFKQLTQDLSLSDEILPTSCLSVFDHFVGLVFKGLTIYYN